MTQKANRPWDSGAIKIPSESPKILGTRPFLVYVDEWSNPRNTYEEIKASLEYDEMLVFPKMIEESPELFSKIDPQPVYLIKHNGKVTVASSRVLDSLRGYIFVSPLYLVQVRMDAESPCGIFNLTSEEYLANKKRYQVLKMSAKVIPQHMKHQIDIVSIDEYRSNPDYYELVEILYAVRFKTEI